MTGQDFVQDKYADDYKRMKAYNVGRISAINNKPVIVAISPLWEFVQRVTGERPSSEIKNKLCDAAMFEYMGELWVAIKGLSEMHDGYKLKAIACFNYTRWHRYIEKRNKINVEAADMLVVDETYMVIPLEHYLGGCWALEIEGLFTKTYKNIRRMHPVFFEFLNRLTMILPQTDVEIHRGTMVINDTTICNLMYNYATTVDRFIRQLIKSNAPIYNLYYSLRKDALPDDMSFDNAEILKAIAANWVFVREDAVLNTFRSMGVNPELLSLILQTGYIISAFPKWGDTSLSCWIDSAACNLYTSRYIVNGHAVINDSKIVFNDENDKTRYLGIEKNLYKHWVDNLIRTNEYGMPF